VPTESETVEALGDAIPDIRSERLRLVSMSVPFMEALVARDLVAADTAIRAQVPSWLPGQLDHFLQYRLGQLAVDPSIRHWLGRAMILDDEDRPRVVGTIGFHGPPDDQGRLEVGYSVDPAFRRRGFAREAIRAMFDWAASTHGIHRFIASISPTNEPSLRLAAGFGFVQTGSQVDDIDGLELVFEAGWPPAIVDATREGPA
jgi:RimJ/RimL family protein N-acetyltransferase